jgi:hypothetical protein
MNRELFGFIKYTPADDAGGGEIVLEGVFETEGNEEELFFLEGDPDIPIIDENEPIKDIPEIKALKDQNELLQQQMAGLKTQADSTAALTKGLENLGENLRQPVVQQVQQPPVDPVAAKKEFDDKFYNAPSDGLDAFAKAKIEPALQQIMLTNANLSKQLLAIDPERSETYKKYGPEIDETFNQMSIQKKVQNPSAAAKEAADIVASRHISETRASMKEEIMKEVLAELKGNPPAGGDNTGAGPVIHSESGVTKKVPGQKGKAFILPVGVWAYAAQMGYQGRGEKEDKARVYQWWREGQLPDCGIDYK